MLFRNVLILTMFTGHVALAHALDKQFTCVQTEPFMTTIYDTEAGTSVTRDDQMDKIIDQKSGLSFYQLDSGDVTIQGADGRLITTLKLTFAGTDDMSDNIFPYDGGRGPDGSSIACESSRLKAMPRVTQPSRYTCFSKTSQRIVVLQQLSERVMAPRDLPEDQTFDDLVAYKMFSSYGELPYADYESVGLAYMADVHFQFQPEALWNGRKVEFYTFLDELTESSLVIGDQTDP